MGCYLLARLAVQKTAYGFCPSMLSKRLIATSVHHHFRALTRAGLFTPPTSCRRLPSQAVASDSKSETSGLDPSVTVYYHPNKHSISIDLESGTIKSAEQNKKLDEAFDNVVTEKLKDSIHTYRQKKHESSLKTEDDAVISIDDMLGKELRSHIDLAALPNIYLNLAKMRLTGLVMVTAMAGYAMAPGAFSITSFCLCCLGTGLTSAAANAINQFLEVPFDSQMARTKTRPLVKAQLSPLHAVSFAACAGLTGSAMLLFGVNELTAALGVFNLLLYTSLYTPMKRLSIANTWVGSIVGAIPPMMGWAASAGTLHIGAFLLGAIMYAWQFPHFCALSWNLRPDYSRAGYRMMCVINPGLCQRTALRYSVVLSGLCLLVSYCDVTTWTFAADSLPLNAYLVLLAWRFYHKGDSHSSRKLFHFSLVHLPALLILMLISKKQFGPAASELETSSAL